MLASLLCFGLLEAVLAVAGVEGKLLSDDPFVGFASNVPLFAEETGADKAPVMVTAGNKLGYFNAQRFHRNKPAGVYRIFCVGGSTTYGRPYDDRTSFAGWLRELLPASDPGRSWEVINAGGISYASYRIAHLMEELVRYEPDLFVVYTGHNEFLEERSYSSLRDAPAGFRLAMGLLARTRLWSAVSACVRRVEKERRAVPDARSVLPPNVAAKLDSSAGPALYHRDDALACSILEHYRVSLGRMVDLARSSGADIVFVTPASNLKDCTPFKSQDTDGLSDGGKTRSQTLLAHAREAIGKSRFEEALGALDAAVDINPRFAGLHYQRGRVLFALGRFEEAKEALSRARDEDVCPLRALSVMDETVRQVADQRRVTLVDFVKIIERRMQAEHGHTIAGAELFLDHVHPTIEGNKLLGVALVEAMIDNATVQPSASWNEDAIDEVSSKIERSLDDETRAVSLANLALVLNWAGKTEDSRRLAFQALETGVEDATILAVAARHLIREGELNEALAYYRRALRASPRSPATHFQIGELLLGLNQREAAAAHLLVVTALWPDNDEAHYQLGLVMAKRGRYVPALSSLREARRLNPGRGDIDAKLRAIRDKTAAGSGSPDPPQIAVTRYPSGAPRKYVQARRSEQGQWDPDGIWTEWFENGDLKGFADFEAGVRHGVEVFWDSSGREVSRTEYNRGAGMGSLRAP